MKKVTLCGINARFSHSCLALLCLKYAAGGNADIAEFTINDRVPGIVGRLAARAPDVLGFSCYIWNIEQVLKIASSVKKILPNCFVFLGGPEVSYDSDSIMQKYTFIDMIIRGKGEASFSYFMERFNKGKSIEGTPSACIRGDEGIITTADAPAYDMNSTPFMYEDLNNYKNKTIYYETSRGCPFRCAYCMSANEDTSFLPMDRVRAELEHFVSAGVQQVKLVDRTFNYPADRAYRIVKHIVELSEAYPSSLTNFHLELTASLLDDNMLSLLRQAKKGLFHIEAGIQSTNPETLRAVDRNCSIRKLLENIGALCRMDNIHVHADLIAGLPLESYETFGKSFDDAYRLKPDTLQLGFLKVLKGSPLRSRAEEYGIVYTEYAPYEVLKTSDITYQELAALHMIERILSELYNSGRCRNALERIIPAFRSPFGFFERFASYLDRTGYFLRPQKRQAIFEQMLCFIKTQDCDPEIIIEALMLDWLCLEGPKNWPSGMEPAVSEGEKKKMRGAFADEKFIGEYLPVYKGLSPKQISRKCFIYSFNRLFPGKTAVLFDYGKKPEDENFYQQIDYIG